ncbi:hypothetical protein Fot_06297 [Forsythia ovata]|uniref:Uncharacterized protein n=1 Tax=Forsythia ovata TaxID=205694 RepID=A0ABD1WVK5_9LAMI
MANKLISQMGLPKSIANVFKARNIITAKVGDLDYWNVAAAAAGLNSSFNVSEEENNISLIHLPKLGTKKLIKNSYILPATFGNCSPKTQHFSFSFWSNNAIHGHDSAYSTAIFPHNIGIGATRQV